MIDKVKKEKKQKNYYNNYIYNIHYSIIISNNHI